MAINTNQKIKTIVLLQNWSAGKIELGTEYILKDSNRTIKLIEDPEYPNGKFVFDNGEVFEAAKYFNDFFIKKIDEKEETKAATIYDEDTWDEIDKRKNGESKSLIRKTIAADELNEAFQELFYYDVTEIIDEIINRSKENNTKFNNNIYSKILEYLINNNYPFFTKEKLYILFDNCVLKETNDPHFIRVFEKSENVKYGKDVGYLFISSGKYIFSPRKQELTDEYKFENNNSSGFFYTAENYLDIALSTLERYKKNFVPLHSTILGKNKESYGYQADASIKTLLAFSCECYLKSLILNSGKDLNDIKELGHGLSVLYTSLSDDEIAKIFSYMERNGYDIDNAMYYKNFETNDLTEKFMLDLARVDDAFIDARYSAENDKNTDYSFLYRFALALRNCSKKAYNICSPFDSSIESKMSRK